MTDPVLIRVKGEKSLGDTNKKEVHDLDNEKVSCQIDEIVRPGHDKPFATHAEAKAAAYDNRAWCIGGSTT